MPALSENVRGPQSIQLSPESELPRLEKNYARAVAKWSQTGGPPELLQSGPKRVVQSGPELFKWRNMDRQAACCSPEFRTAKIEANSPSWMLEPRFRNSSPELKFQAPEFEAQASILNSEPIASSPNPKLEITAAQH